MGLFTRTKQEQRGVDADEWRGRARELADVTDLSWQVLMAALQTEDYRVVEETGELFAALGLERGDISRRWPGDVGGTRLSGVRHGRQVEIRIGLRERNWGMAAAMVTWLRVATADPHLDGGRDGAIHPALAADARVWSGLQVRGGPQGLVALRMINSRVHSQGYLYDLWLLERLADTQDGTVLLVVDLSETDMPYRMG